MRAETRNLLNWLYQLYDAEGCLIGEFVLGSDAAREAGRRQLETFSIWKAIRRKPPVFEGAGDEFSPVIYFMGTEGARVPSTATDTVRNAYSALGGAGQAPQVQAVNAKGIE